MMCGGYSQQLDANDEVRQLVANHKAHAEERLNTTFNTFEAVNFETQVVAGTNYKINVKVDDGKTVRLVIFKNLPHNNSTTSLTSAEFA